MLTLDIILKQQDITSSLLRRINNYIDPTALVLGGAPRDWFFNNRCRDLDIYIDSDSFHPYLLTHANSNKLSDLLSKSLDIDIYKDDSSEYSLLQPSTRNFKYIYKGIYLDIPFQLIVVDEHPKNHPSHFDISLSKFSFDGASIHNRMSYNEMMALSNNVVFYNSSINPSYLNKIMDKYSQFEYKSYSIKE